MSLGAPSPTTRFSIDATKLASAFTMSSSFRLGMSGSVILSATGSQSDLSVSVVVVMRSGEVWVVELGEAVEEKSGLGRVIIDSGSTPASCRARLRAESSSSKEPIVWPRNESIQVKRSLNSFETKGKPAMPGTASGPRGPPLFAMLPMKAGLDSSDAQYCIDGPDLET